MKERVKVDITKDAYEQIQNVNFSDVVVRLKSLKCELNLDDKTEKDHCAILDIEIPQEENRMNIDKVETQTEHQEEMSAFSGEVDWKNGDECAFDDRAGIFIGLSKNKRLAIVEIDNEAINHDIDLVKVCDLSKPKTPQQREDRERLEAAYDLYVTHEGYIDNPVCSISIFSESNEPKNKWLAIVDKTNYRKGVK